MAIDSYEKRAAIISNGRPYLRTTLPSGTIDAEERASIGNVWGGNAFGAGITWNDRGRILLAVNPGSWNYYFEATMRAVTGEMNARLYDKTADAAVANSKVSTTSTTKARHRSGTITVTDGSEYYAQDGVLSGDSGEIWGAEAGPE